MNLTAYSLALPTLVFGWLAFGFMLVWSLKTAPWYKLQDKASQHVILAMTVLIFFLWQLGASVHQDFSLHFLLMSLLTMMLGVQFAILSMALALIGVVWQQQLGWQAYAINAVVMGMVPILISWGLYRLGAKFLAANFFVYLLYNGFFSGAVSMLGALSLGTLLLWLNEVVSTAQLLNDYLLYMILLVTPEGILNTFLLMMLVFIKPHWVMTFYQDKYFNNKS